VNERCPPERLLALGHAAGLNLSADQVSQLQTYLALLAHWNKTVNLTALSLTGFPDGSLSRLIGEGLTCASLLSSNASLPINWFDLGSGGGSPAVPMKIVLPSAPLTMVEARARKAAFLREAVRALELRPATVLNSRVEELNEQVAAGSADLISFRALRLDDDLAKCLKHMALSRAKLALFGDVDWSVLRGDFDVLKRQGGITLLQRRDCST
jgi:16S rRNA (guanine527-N7)-methyltransferase